MRFVLIWALWAMLGQFGDVFLGAPRLGSRVSQKLSATIENTECVEVPEGRTTYKNWTATASSRNWAARPSLEVPGVDLGAS